MLITKDKKMRNRYITICTCNSRSFMDKDKVIEIASVLADNGYEVNLVADLCELVMKKDNHLADIAQSPILACYPRAVQSHFDGLNIAPNQLTDIRNQSVDEVLKNFIPTYTKTENKASRELLKEKLDGFPVNEGIDAWYPVLDKSLCTNCGKCHDFCLFGVYAIENKEVKVVQPQNCKNNCPACARICPSKAIIFPKYAKSPINGGTTEDEQFDPQMMDAMYQERLRYRLQQRRAGVSLLKKNNP